MALHSTHMKRIVAKEFLLLVGCLVILFLVVVFGWVRNSWFEQRSASIGGVLAVQTVVQDSMSQRVVPRHLDFLDLFEPAFVRKNYEVFLVSPFWTMDPFLTGAPGGPILRKVKGDPFATPRVKPPFDPNKPFTVVEDDPFEEFGGRADKTPNSIEVEAPDGSVIEFPGTMTEGEIAAVMQKHYPNINRRYLICIAKALDVQEYLTPARTMQLASICGLSSDDFIGMERELRTAAGSNATSWKPPIDAEEVYTSSMTDHSSVSWIEALHKRGVPREEMSNRVAIARSDTSITLHLLIATRGLLCDTLPFTELRAAFDFLKERHVLNCDVDDLLYTLQNKAVPPSQEALDAFAGQRAAVNELRKAENDARTSLWSEAKQWAVVKWAAIVLLVVVYPLRLLVLGTRWALRTLRA